MLNLKTFETCLNELQEIHEKGFTLATILGCGVVEYSAGLEAAMLTALEETMQDADNYIGWWLYEDVDKIVKLKEGGTIDLTTPVALYNFLVMEAR